MHPRTRAKIDAFRLNGTGITMIEPVGHLEMLYAVRSAELVLTDSGGLQEETTVLGVPCITIRENTERPVTVDIGTNNLVGTDPEKIQAVAFNILSGQGKKGAIPPLWDGKAAERIAANLLQQGTMAGTPLLFDITLCSLGASDNQV